MARIIPSGTELAGVYNATAWYWDSFVHRISYGWAYRNLFNRLLATGSIDHAHPPGRVLDCGIGAGAFSGALIEALGRSVDLFGIDVSAAMMTRARRRLKELGVVPRLQFADIRQLPFEDGQMDLVISALTLEHLPEPLAAIQEMARVAKPGAPIVVVTTRRLAPEFLFRAVYRYRPFRPAQLAHWMSQAGLVGIQRYSLTGIARPFGYACAAKTAV